MINRQNPTKRVTSRLARKEQKKLSRQTFGMVFLSIVILLFFIFVLLPGGVRLFFSFLDSNTGIDNSDSIPPQVPILSAPLEATYSAMINLSGYAEPKSKVIVVLGGEKETEFIVDDDGSFSHDLDLSEGGNSFSLYSIDEAENESALTKTYSVFFDKDIPVIHVESPENGADIVAKKNQVLSITGNTEPGAKVYLNGRLIYAQNDGSFSSSYRLEEGENSLLFKAVDKAGNTSETELKVNFKY